MAVINYHWDIHSGALNGIQLESIKLLNYFGTVSAEIDSSFYSFAKNKKVLKHLTFEFDLGSKSKSEWVAEGHNDTATRKGREKNVINWAYPYTEVVYFTKWTVWSVHLSGSTTLMRSTHKCSYRRCGAIPIDILEQMFVHL